MAGDHSVAVADPIRSEDQARSDSPVASEAAQELPMSEKYRDGDVHFLTSDGKEVRISHRYVAAMRYIRFFKVNRGLEMIKNVRCTLCFLC